MAPRHNADLGTIFWCHRARGSAPARAQPGEGEVGQDGAGCEQWDSWRPPRCPSGAGRGKRSVCGARVRN